MDELLKILATNALETRANIARLLDVPAAEVDAKIAAYEKAGVIRGTGLFCFQVNAFIQPLKIFREINPS